MTNVSLLFPVCTTDSSIVKTPPVPLLYFYHLQISSCYFRLNIEKKQHPARKVQFCTVFTPIYLQFFYKKVRQGDHCSQHYSTLLGSVDALKVIVTV